MVSEWFKGRQRAPLLARSSSKHVEIGFVRRYISRNESNLHQGACNKRQGTRSILQACKNFYCQLVGGRQLETLTLPQVLVKTTFGDIDIELWSKETPLACRNFVQLCLEGYYNGCMFHRIVRGRLDYQSRQ